MALYKILQWLGIEAGSPSRVALQQFEQQAHAALHPLKFIARFAT
jgi:hypothetical protein